MNVANKGNHLFRPSEWYLNFKKVSTLIWVNLFHQKNTSTIMATRKVLVIICHNLFILKSSAPSVLKVKNSSQKILSSGFCLYIIYILLSFRNSLFKDIHCHTYCAWCSKGTIHCQSMKTSFNFRMNKIHFQNSKMSKVWMQAITNNKYSFLY